MSKRSHTLRALVTERLTAAAEEIFALVERTIAEYEEELCRSKEENQRRQQLLDENKRKQQLLEENQRRQQLLEENQRRQQLLEENQRRQQLLEENQRRQQLLEENQRRQQLLGENQRGRLLLEDNQRRQEVVLHTTNIQIHWSDASLKQEIPETQMKEEPEEQSVKQEDEQLPQFTAVCMKSEEQRQTEYREDCGAAGPHITVEPYGHFHLETEEQTDNSSDYDIDEVWPSASGLAAHMETEADYHHVQIKDTRPAAHSSTLFTKSKSAETRANAGSKAVRKYECHYCKKRFINKQQLKDHVRVHTGERPYSCPVCKKRFTQKTNANVHMRTHTGERPYSCSTCQRAFANSNALRRHERTHRRDHSTD